MINHSQLKKNISSETPYEKCIRKGPSSLSDVELLAIIIRSGTRGRNALEVAQELLLLKEKNLLNLIYMDNKELQNISGIGPIKAIELKAVAELSLRISQYSRCKKLNLHDAHSVAAYYMEQLRHERKEQLIICMFDVKCNMLGDELITVGTADSTMLAPREVFLSALKKESSYIIILHNHPSGIPIPSQEDKRATKRIAQSGNILGIPLMDHIIIGDNSYYSFKEKGLI